MFPFGTFMRLVRQVRGGSRRAMISLLFFLAGLGLGIAGSIHCSGLIVFIGGVMFAAGALSANVPQR